MANEVEEMLASTAEAASLRDLGTHVLPRLERAIGASSSLLYRYDEDGRLVPIAGQIVSLIEHYARNYLHADPIHDRPRQLEGVPRLVFATQEVDLRVFRKSPAYGEFYAAFELEYLACVWLTHRPYATPGMTGMLFTRPRSVGEFQANERRLIGRALPALAAAAARADRLRDLDLQREALEALAASSPAPRLVLAPNGCVVWAAPSAEMVLRAGVPERLRGAIRRFVERPADAPTSVVIDIGRPITAHLSILRAASGALVLVELSGLAPATGDVARRFGLTYSEATVLLKLRDGLSNPAIAHELGVSTETVRTHVRRILAKLGVESRVQAALIAAQIT